MDSAFYFWVVLGVVLATVLALTAGGGLLDVTVRRHRPNPL